MIDSEQHPYVEWIAREARRPVVTDLAARERIMAAVRAEPAPAALPFWRRLGEPRAMRLSPATIGLLAAGLVGIGVLAGGFLMNRDGRTVDQRHAGVAFQQLPVSDTVVRFVFVAPQAQNVSLVGDFNGWDASKTPMDRAANNGVWTVTLPLSQGRHVYSFLVDGKWSVDPNAPLAPDDGFGHANSVKIVRKGSAL
jgi:hypothetical protein